MRFPIILFFLLLNTAIAGAQDFYYVTVIRGVVRKQDRSALKTGDKLLANDKLIFANKDCRILLLHPRLGRFVLEAEKTPGGPTGELLLFLKNNLHLQTQTLKLSSRGDMSIEDFFATSPSCNSSLLFIGDTKIDLQQSGYLQSDTLNNFFFLQYSSMDGNVYNNRLRIIRDSLIIGESSFLFNGSRHTDGREVKIGYMKYSNHTRGVKQIAVFKPIFISVKECNQLFLTIKKTIGGSKEEILDEAYTQLCYLYGKPWIESLNSILDKL